MPVSPRPYLIYLISIAFLLFQFLLQVSPGVFVEQLMRDLSMSATSAGVMTSAYYYVYVALQIPAGVLMDRYGARWLTSIGALICAAGCALFALCHQVWVADVARVLMGLGSAFAFVATMYLVSRWFPGRYFALVFGVGDTLVSLSTIMINVFVAKVVVQAGWRTCMWSAALIAIIISILAVMIVRDQPDDFVTDSTADKLTLREQLSMILGDYRLWCNGVFVGAFFAIAAVYSGMWGVPFITLETHVSTETATILASLVFLGLAIGTPIAGWCYPRIEHCLRQVYVGFVLAGLILMSWLIYCPPSSLVMYGVAMVLLGMLVAVYIISFTYAKTLVPEQLVSTCMGFTNAVCVGLVPIMQPLIGYLLDFARRQRGGVDYVLHDYRIALLVMPAALLVAAALTKPIFTYSAQVKAT